MTRREFCLFAPHLPEAYGQNLIVTEAFLRAAKRYVCGGYDVIVDGVIGPWFLGPWRNIVREGDKDKMLDVSNNCCIGLFLSYIIPTEKIGLTVSCKIDDILEFIPDEKENENG